MKPELFPTSPADFAASDLFERTFKEGMDLVEETAAYLEGAGREASRGLSRLAALAYAAESMKLTTRLMQVASWLLVHRAVREGEMTSDEAREERYRLIDKAKTVPNGRDFGGRDAGAALPDALGELIARAERLYSRVARLDERLSMVASPLAETNPVQRQIARLEAALKAAHRWED